MNLWEVITGNSTLPVQSGTTLWDHLNNQAGGVGGLITATVSVLVRRSPVVSVDDVRSISTVSLVVEGRPVVADVAAAAEFEFMVRAVRVEVGVQ